jgi:hypothetical protein
LSGLAAAWIEDGWRGIEAEGVTVRASPHAGIDSSGSVVVRSTIQISTFERIEAERNKDVSEQLERRYCGDLDCTVFVDQRTQKNILAATATR